MKSHAGATLLAIGTLFFSGQALGAYLYWNCSNGSVSNPGCWSPTTLPTPGDIVYVRNSGTAIIDSDDSLDSASSYIGYNNLKGTVEESGGTHTVHSTLYNAYVYSPSGVARGKYQLSGDGNLQLHRAA